MEQLENYYHYNPHHRKAYCEVKVKVLVTQSHLTVCNPMDCSPPGSSVHGILRQEHWSGQPFPSPEHLPDPGIKRGSPALQADSLPSEPPGKPKGYFSKYPLWTEVTCRDWEAHLKTKERCISSTVPSWRVTGKLYRPDSKYFIDILPKCLSQLFNSRLEHKISHR